MSSTLESIAQKLHRELDPIIQQVSTVEGVPSSVYEREEQLWVRMLGLGRHLLPMHFEAQYEAEVVHDQVRVDGVGYAYERSRQRA